MLQRRRRLITPSRIARVAVGAFAVLLVGPFAPAPYAVAAAAPAMVVDLGTAASYSVLAGTGITNTGAATVLAGDLGLSPRG